MIIRIIGLIQIVEEVIFECLTFFVMCIAGFNVETVEYKNISFTVWDVGGQDKVRERKRRNML